MYSSCIVALLASWIAAGSGSGEGTSPWSTPVTFRELQSVTLRWRILEQYRAGGKNFFEIEFSRTSDTPACFDYVAETDAGEKRFGHLCLKKYTKSLSGWYSAGRRIMGVAVADRLSQNTAADDERRRR